MPVKQGIQKVGGNFYAYQPAHLCPFMVARAVQRVKRSKRITQNKMSGCWYEQPPDGMQHIKLIMRLLWIVYHTPGSRATERSVISCPAK